MSDLRNLLDEHLARTAAALEALRNDDALAAAFETTANAWIETLRAGGKILLFGNGGSAADSQHLAAELVGRFRRERTGLPAVALTTDTSALSAIANDYGYEDVFRRQLEALGRAGDVAVGLSTSGRAENVVRALRHANEAGLVTVALTGKDGGPAAGEANVALRLPGDDTAHVQELTIAVGHALCEAVDRAFAS